MAFGMGRRRRVRHEAPVGGGPVPTVLDGDARLRSRGAEAAEHVSRLRRPGERRQRRGAPAAAGHLVSEPAGRHRPAGALRLPLPLKGHTVIGVIVGGLFATAVFLYPALQLKKRNKWHALMGILMFLAGLGLVGVAVALARLATSMTSVLIVGGIALILFAGFLMAT